MIFIVKIGLNKLSIKSSAGIIPIPRMRSKYYLKTALILCILSLRVSGFTTSPVNNDIAFNLNNVFLLKILFYKKFVIFII